MKNQHIVVWIYHWKPHSAQYNSDVARNQTKPNYIVVEKN